MTHISDQLSSGVWLDRGLRSGAEHVASDAALLSGVSQPTLHFHRYLPTACLGRYECADTSIRTDYCRSNHIEVVHRVAGGEAMYLDGAQQCWTLAFPADSAEHREPLASLFNRHAALLVAAFGVLGVCACHAPPGDIEVEGRKLASLTIARDTSGTLLHGVLLLDIDVERTLRVLRVPIEKLSPQGVQNARQRFVTLGEVIPGTFAAEGLYRALVAATAEEFNLSWTALESQAGVAQRKGELRTPRAVPEGAARSFAVVAGGVLHAWVLLADDERSIIDAGLSASIHCSPPTLLADLESALRGSIDDWRERLRGALARIAWESVGLTGTEFESVVAQTLARLAQQRNFGLQCDEANTIMLCDDAGLGAAEILQRATVMLVPYCVKLVTCKWRYRDGCPECGLCNVGDAYRLARGRGMRVVSITNFEHLQDTLTSMRRQRVEGYVGMCCSEFFLKRHYAFRAAGIPGVLLDISGANCYELQQEEMAYVGRFDAQASLNGAVMEKVMQFVPPRGDAIGRG